MAPSLLTSVVVMALIVGPGMSSVIKPRPQKWELAFRSLFFNKDAATSAAARNIARLMKQMVGNNVVRFEDHKGKTIRVTHMFILN